MAQKFELVTIDGIRERLAAGVEVRLWCNFCQEPPLLRVEDVDYGRADVRLVYPSTLDPSGECHITVSGDATMRVAKD